MSKKLKKPMIKELIIAKKLLLNSRELIKSDTLENNLIACSNLNSALEIFIKIISTQQKIMSIKQLDNISLEKQWSILTDAYKSRYGEELSMKTQIFTLNNIIKDYTERNLIPNSIQIQELGQALSIFMEQLALKIFNIDFLELDFHFLFDNAQVRRTLKNAKHVLEGQKYGEVLKKTSLAFHIALEDQRQKLNFLSEQGLLKPELLMLEKPIELHINPKDHEFIHLILGTNPKKLEQFKQLVPTVLITEDDSKRPKIIVSDFVDNNAISEDNAKFCLNFVFETILHWESLKLMKEK